VKRKKSKREREQQKGKRAYEVEIFLKASWAGHSEQAGSGV
jgi:hypothetical protein